MEQYISKAAIIAEIERLINSHEPLKTLDPTYCEGLNDSLDDILSFLDTIEVKEVDLEKEATEFIQTKEFVESKENPVLLIARHFYELGLNAQRKINYVPNIDDILKKESINPDSKEAKIFKESYYIALEKLKSQRGE